MYSYDIAGKDSLVFFIAVLSIDVGILVARMNPTVDLRRSD
jgi:hypothetical protein